ncbi:MAG: sodium:proton antiporter NhaD [Alphaproteobacteria bacterium]|nr:sodium:proton antiporter NhaD [Alphaproteobacteria bacterium]
MMTSTYAIAALLIFIVAYVLVMVEEFTHLKKSKPVIIAAGLIWILVALAAGVAGQEPQAANAAFRHVFLEFAELFIFLLVAMTYINSMTERNVFEALRAWLVTRNFNYHKIFWITGILAFFLSPIADNLTTALFMCAVVMAVGAGNQRFIVLGCINIVVAANAGGAFSPFGDITTLMVWQKGVLSFFEFFPIFIPAAVSYLIPAILMYFAIPAGQPKTSDEAVIMKVGAKRVILLFLLTIAFTVSSHQLFHMPPAFGMMTGFGVLAFFGFYLTRLGQKTANPEMQFDIFAKVARAEWDTLFFFYGVLICVAGLAAFGYLAAASQIMYVDLGATTANVLVGILSAIVDNIPVMFAVLTMFPAMDGGQWLLVTLTAGIGGSLLSIGSAAGVAVMGQARGIYTFFSHLRWSWAIALGYAAGIYTHFLVNRDLFDGISLTLH